jgi:hypothetical protein
MELMLSILAMILPLLSGSEVPGLIAISPEGALLMAISPTVMTFPGRSRLGLG